MANTRIKDLSTTASAAANDDYLAIDGSTNGTRKILASDIGGSGSVDWSDVTNKPTFATVATSGDYDDLTDKPTLATVATSGAYSDLTGKPTLATVATSGSYADLSNKPTIPTKTSDLTNDSGFITLADLPIYNGGVS